MKRNKVLLIGSGGREMALLMALQQSPLEPEVIVAPGSDAMRELARCRDIAVEDIAAIVTLAQAESVDLCIIGPEIPLAMGLTDALLEAGIKVFGPTQAAAEIESSKAYAKDLMKRAGVPTARYETYHSRSHAIAALDSWTYPLVIKENGLKAGKGVSIVATKTEAQTHIQDVEFSADAPLLFEEFLDGFEFSLICLVSGQSFIPLPVAQDYKAIFDQQQGPNTGGMGAVSPVSRLDEAIYQEAIDQVIRPTLKALADDGRSFTGFLYAGLMATTNGVQVIEFNARMGDPEAEIILPRLQGDLLQAILDLLSQDSSTQKPLPFHPQTSLGVVLSSPGYPGAITHYPFIPDAFFAAAEAHGIQAIHMGTKRIEGGYLASGGRVLMLTCIGENIAECRRRIYEFLDAERDLIADFHYRTDIGLAAE